MLARVPRVDTYQLHVREGPRKHANPGVEWEAWELDLPRVKTGEERTFSLPLYDP